MIAQMKWLDRRFEGDLPLGAFPGIVERLRGTPPRLEEIVGRLSAVILTRRVDNAWSIQEHAGHLLDLSELDETRLADYKAGKETLTAWDGQNRKTFEANHNAGEIRDILKEFRAARMQFVYNLERLEEHDVARSSIHPRLRRKMSVVDWCHFLAEHDDHHLARMTALSVTLSGRT